MQTKYLRELKASRSSNDRYISSEELESRAGMPLTRDQIKLLKRAYKGMLIFVPTVWNHSIRLKLTQI